MAYQAVRLSEELYKSRSASLRANQTLRGRTIILPDGPIRLKKGPIRLSEGSIELSEGPIMFLTALSSAEGPISFSGAFYTVLEGLYGLPSHQNGRPGRHHAYKWASIRSQVALLGFQTSMLGSQVALSGCQMLR